MKAIAVSLAVSDIALTASCSAIGDTSGNSVQAPGSQHLAQLILTPVRADAVHFHVLVHVQQPDLVKLQDSPPAGDAPQLGSLGPLNSDLRDHGPVHTYEEAADAQPQLWEGFRQIDDITPHHLGGRAAQFEWGQVSGGVRVDQCERAVDHPRAYSMEELLRKRASLVPNGRRLNTSHRHCLHTSLPSRCAPPPGPKERSPASKLHLVRMAAAGIGSPGGTQGGRPVVRVLIVDDHRVVADGLRLVLDEHPDLQVIGTAGDGATALRLASVTPPPDLVLVDYRLPDMTSAELAGQIRDSQPGVRVLFLSMVVSAPLLREAVK